MKFRLPLAILAAALVATVVHAQDDDDDDQEFDYFAYFSRAKSNMTFGFRLTEGAKVKFGNLGSIPAANAAAPLSSDSTANNVLRNYDNGAVGADAQRTPETDGTATFSSPNGSGRYQTHAGEVDGRGVPVTNATGGSNAQVTYVTGDYITYVPGSTRNYAINSVQGQLKTDASGHQTGVAFSQYSTTSDGEGFNGKRAISGGFEFEAQRSFSDPGSRIRFALAAGLSLNGINSKRTGSVLSTLNKLTDTYSFTPAGGMTGLPTSIVTSSATSAAVGFTAPDFNTSNYTYPDTAGNTIVAGTEDSAPLNLTFQRDISTSDEEVSGVWEVKGAYVVLRLGPEVSGSVTPNLSFNAGAGVAGAWVGTNYSANESATLTDTTLINTTITTGTITSEENKFLAGYYANFDAAWAVNERTGFYAGLSYESFGDFTQSLAGRTARIDLGGAASVRGGINIKF